MFLREEVMSGEIVRHNVEHQQSNQKIPQFSVGLNVFMEMKTDKNVSLRAQANIIGWHKRSILITTEPTINDSQINVSKGVNCIVRYIHQGSAFGFATNLLEKHEQLAHMWLLDFPKNVETKPLRQAPRVDVLIPAENPENKKWNILNISCCGALICMDGEFPDLGTKIEFSFLLPDGDKVENLKAEVARHQKNPAQKDSVGVKFSEGQDEKTKAIKTYCENYQSNHPMK